MKDLYVATILNRIFLGEDNFIFYPSHTAVGEYDEKTQIFKDSNGEEYCHISDPASLQSELSSAFFNLESIDNLPEIAGTNDINEAIRLFHNMNKRRIYFVSKTKDNIYFAIPIECDDLKKNITNAIKQA